MWAQWDWGEGPRIGGRRTNLFCAWLAWSRHRVVIPTWDRTLPTVIGCLDRAMRIWGGVQTYWLTDNERTVSIDHVAGIAVRNPNLVAAASHYGVTVATCVPYDPESKGGSEATVRIAKADLVPDRGQPASRVLELERTGRGLRRVHGRGERPAAPGHPAGAERDAGRRGPAPASTARRRLHRRLRRDPPCLVVGHHQLRRRAVLGAAHPGRLGGVGPGRGRRAGGDASGRTGRHRSGPPHAVDPGASADRRCALSASSTGRARAPTQGDQRGRSGLLGAGRRGPPVAGRSRSDRAPPASRSRWRARWRWLASMAPTGSTWPSDRPPSMGASPKATWPRSSPPNPTVTTAAPRRSTRSRVGTSAWKGFGT